MIPMGSITALRPHRPKVLEFFAGIGLARLGLERAGFKVAWSNDCEPDKMALYQGHFRDAQHGREHVFDPRDIGGGRGQRRCASQRAARLGLTTMHGPLVGWWPGWVGWYGVGYVLALHRGAEEARQEAGPTCCGPTVSRPAPS